MLSISSQSPIFSHQSHSRGLNNRQSIVSPSLSIMFGAQLKPGVRLAIFTTNVGGSIDPNTESLIDEAKKQGVQLTVFHPSDVVLQANGSKLTFWLRGQPFEEKPFDVVYPRLGARYVTEEGLNILKHLENMGTVVINPPDGLRVAEDKYKTHLAFAKNKVPQPNTLYVPTQLSILTQEQFNALDSQDVFVKPNAYTSGSRDVKRFSQATLQDVLNYRPKRSRMQLPINAKPPRNVLVQRSLANGEGIEDYRCMVFNGQILWSTLKEAISPMDSDYYTVEPTPDMTEAAIKAVKAVGIRSATVDMVHTENEGFKVVEVNPSPGLADDEEVESLLDAVINFANTNSKKKISLLA